MAATHAQASDDLTADGAFPDDNAPDADRARDDRAQGDRAPFRSAWRDVPPRQVREFAALALEEVPALAQDILREIRAEYPGLPVVLDDSGEPMALIGIRRALEGFVQQLASQEGRPRYHLEVFQEFGRGEGLHGRSLDSLQAIYRLGVRLAWRRLAEIGQQIEIPPPAMYELAESGFEYLDGLVDQSVRGYAEAAAREAGERLRLQRKLMELLLSDRRSDSTPNTSYGSGHGSGPGTGAAALGNGLGERAARVGWQLPERVAVGVLLRPARRPSRPPSGRASCSTWRRSSPAWSYPTPTRRAAPNSCAAP